jgi:hypothetical protein
VIYEINSFRVDCVGAGPMNCLQVRCGAETTGDSQNFYASIEGFQYEPGYVCRLLVRETPLPREEVPADASSIRFELGQVIDKTRDPRLALHDIWVLRRIEGADIDAFGSAPPAHESYIEFNVTRGEYLGNDGCSEVRGSILALDAARLRLGLPGGSTVACKDASQQTKLLAALARVGQWRREGLELRLLDDGGSEVLAFRKAD